MKTVIDLPVEVQEVIMDFTDFVTDPEVGCLLPYLDLIKKFNSEYPEQRYSVFINSDDPENEGYFDFEFGCLGGTFSLLDNGEPHLDVIQWYSDPEEGEEPEAEEFELKFKKKDVIDYKAEKEFAERILDHLSLKNLPTSEFLPEAVKALQKAFPAYNILTWTDAYTNEILNDLVGRYLIAHVGVRDDDNKLTVIALTKGV